MSSPPEFEGLGGGSPLLFRAPSQGTLDYFAGKGVGIEVRFLRREYSQAGDIGGRRFSPFRNSRKNTQRNRHLNYIFHGAEEILCGTQHERPVNLPLGKSTGPVPVGPASGLSGPVDPEVDDSFT
jgi:hypothetical protein